MRSQKVGWFALFFLCFVSLFLFHPSNSFSAGYHLIGNGVAHDTFVYNRYPDTALNNYEYDFLDRNTYLASGNKYLELGQQSSVGQQGENVYYDNKYIFLKIRTPRDSGGNLQFPQYEHLIQATISLLAVTDKNYYYEENRIFYEEADIPSTGVNVGLYYSPFDGWDEDSLTWDIATNWDSSFNSYTLLDTRSITGYGRYTWDLKNNDVFNLWSTIQNKEWMSFMLRIDESNYEGDLFFISSEWTSSGTEPQYYFHASNDPNDQSTPNPVPEPGTIALLGIGLAGLGVYGYRRRSKA
jgi:hypothetical protein